MSIGDCIQLIDSGFRGFYASRVMRPSGEYAKGDGKTFFLDALSNPFRGMGFLSLTIKPPLSMMTCFWVLVARFFCRGDSRGGLGEGGSRFRTGSTEFDNLVGFRARGI